MRRCPEYTHRRPQGLAILLSCHACPLVGRYALFSIPAAAFAALQKYAASNAALAMRENLTMVLHRRYSTATSLPTALASVEEVTGGDEGVQRGTADLDAYCTQSVTLFEALVKPSAEVILISTKLAIMMGPSQLLSCATFFGVAGSWVRMVGCAECHLIASPCSQGS